MTRAGFRVLIVDDEPTVCERLCAELERFGLEVETHTDSNQALARIAEQCFDVVITDIKMRGPSGIDVTRFVAEHCPSAKVIVITGFATAETAQQVFREGAVEFIPKPFKLSQLRDLVLGMVADRGVAAGGSGQPSDC